MLTEREKFLMREAWSTGLSGTYRDLDQWLPDPIDDVGHTVEHHIDWDADRLYRDDMEAH